ncbi:MAG: class B sortase [Christensenellaceae bacterium]|nr:class B sortase [Christensenellaceae bacterium]
MRKRKKQQKRVTILVAGAGIALCLTIALIATINIARIQLDYNNSAKEYADLRAFAPVEASVAPAGSSDAPGASGAYASLGQAEGETLQALESEKVKSLSEINADYTAWLRIPGTKVDYPVVFPPNNEKYLKTGFRGTANPQGTLFVDVRNQQAFGGLHAIIYGHNSQNGEMFGALQSFMHGDYLADHQRLELTLKDGTCLNFKVVAVWKTSVSDKVFTLYGADDEAIRAYFGSVSVLADARKYLTLSTCTSGGSDEERLLLHAVLE